MKNLQEVNAAAVDYLMFSGYVTVAYFWAEAAIVSEKALKNGGALEDEFYKTKIATADFYFDRIMPRILAHEAAIKNGMSSMMDIDEDKFLFI